MKLRFLIIMGLLALMVVVPISMRRISSTANPNSAQDRLVILTPHNESIRQEFGEAFAAYWKQQTGRSVYVDWRTPGGTSEIRMVLDAGYKAAREAGREGMGVDLFFGGGEPDFSGQAKKGRFMELDVFKKEPELFSDPAVIPQTFTGERYYGAERNWIAVCMSQFGICYNPDVLQRLNLPRPAQWIDLGDPRYAGQLALADPTKSGSVARAFELIIQSEMQRVIARSGKSDATLEEGWSTGLQLVQKLAANSRYFTDSASKIPHDVSMGDAAAGMCIDFYGRSYGELTTRDGRPRLEWCAPRGGTTLSGDPIAVLKGAPHPQVAQAFVSYCLTSAAQQLWFGKPGTPHGPQSRALHRMPIRKDLYTQERLAISTMPDVQPYADPGNFNYQRDLTGPSFNTIRQLVKIMCIDSHEEMKNAWLALRDAGMPPDALAVFLDTSPLPYAIGGKGDPLLDGNDSIQAAERAAQLGEQFRANYRKAEQMAKTSHLPP